MICPSCKEACAKVADEYAEHARKKQPELIERGRLVAMQIEGVTALAASNVAQRIRALPSPPADMGGREALVDNLRGAGRLKSGRALDLDEAEMFAAVVLKWMQQFGFRCIGPGEVVVPREFVGDAANVSNELQRMYDGQDEERRERKTYGSQHREIFEAYLDDLQERARAMLGAKP